MSQSCISIKLVTIFYVLCLTTIGCTKQNARSGIDPRPEARAAEQVTQSFAEQKISSKSETLVGTDHAHVILKKAALGKEFLLSVNMLRQSPTPMFSSLQSRVISFILRDQQIFMLDSSTGHSVGENNISQNLLLAQFKILAETNDAFEIDFNSGMKEIFTEGDMFSSDDFSGTINYELPLAQVQMSYLDEVSIENNQLLIRQIAQLVSHGQQGSTAKPVEVRYYLTPYLPDPDFIPTKSPGFDKVGYFEANPLLLADGSNRIYAMKWNDKKPIQFAISANTPLKYRELVKSAVLYWNKILGPNHLQVIQLEDPKITAPNPNYNIIQWADWDSAGYAYADAHIDPRSGQVTHAQVFLPSAFVDASVPRRVRLFEGEQNLKTKTQIGLKGFRSARLCQRNLAKDLQSLDVPPQVTDAAMDKAMRDYVYEVIAHEVGHLMGLRHNFAGNLAANYDTSQRREMALSYYQNQKAPAGVVTSSSVMEYSRFEESAWNGDMLRHEATPALTYDTMAIQYLYNHQELPESRPLFCTDSQIAKYVDCNMSDAGQSIVSYAHDFYKFNLKTLAVRTLNNYILRTKLPESEAPDRISVSEVVLDPKVQAQNMAVDFYKLLSLLKSDSKFIKVRGLAGPANPIFEEQMQQKEQAYLAAEFQRLGGVKSMLSVLPEDLDVQLSNYFDQLLADPQYSTGAAVGQKFDFSEAEKKIMSQNFALFATQFKKQLILQELKAISGEQTSFEGTYGQAILPEPPHWIDHPLTAELAQVSLERFLTYGIGKTEQTLPVDITGADGAHTSVQLPIYKYDLAIRTASAKVFSNGHEALEWGLVEKKKASQAIKEQISILGNPDEINLEILPTPALKWLLQNQQVQQAL